MKKLFFVAVAASVAFAACVKNEPAVQENKQAISFAAPVVGTATKATTEISNNFPTDVDFAVWAHYYAGGTYSGFASGDEYMQDVVVEWDGEYDGWAPQYTYYWPKNGSLTFSAYSPASATATIGETGICFEGYEVSTTASNQVDLLFSERAYNKTAIDDDEAKDGTTSSDPAVTEDPYAGVHLSFNHAMSSILFSVYGADRQGHEIVLKKIELTNICSKGDFNQGLEDSTGATTDSDADLWTNEENEVTYTISLNKSLEEGYPYFPCIDDYIKEEPYLPAAENGKTPTDWLLLPQEIADDAQLIITYTLKSPDSEALEQVIPVTLKTQTVSEWKWGYRYHYVITITLDKIFFEPYVAPWVDGTSSTLYF